MTKRYDGTQAPQPNLVGSSPRFWFYDDAACLAGIDFVAEGGGPTRNILFMGEGVIDITSADYSTSLSTAPVLAGQSMDIQARSLGAGSVVATGIWVLW